DSTRGPEPPIRRTRTRARRAVGRAWRAESVGRAAGGSTAPTARRCSLRARARNTRARLAALRPSRRARAPGSEPAASPRPAPSPERRASAASALPSRRGSSHVDVHERRMHARAGIEAHAALKALVPGLVEQPLDLVVQKLRVMRVDAAVAV